MSWSDAAEVFVVLGRIVAGNPVIVPVVILFVMTVLMNYAAMVMLLNMKTIEKRKEISMDRVEEVALDIERLVTSKYLSLAKEYLGDNYFNEMEVRLVKYNISEAIDLIKDEYRRRVRRNGFEDKTAMEWNTYVEATILEDMNRFTKVVDTSYHPASEVPRPVWYDLNKREVDPESIHKIRHLMEELLAIAEHHKLHRFFIWRICL